MDDEFRIDFLDLLGHLPPSEQTLGRLGMARLPGYDPSNLGRDIEALRAAKTALLVTLVMEAELHWIPGLMRDDIGFFPMLIRSGIVHRHFPIVGMGVPSSMRDFAELVDEVASRLMSGQNVVIHCLAGLGRTGLLAACCLVRLGLTPPEAMRAIRRVRPGTIETDSQEGFVERFAEHLAAQD